MQGETAQPNDFLVQNNNLQLPKDPPSIASRPEWKYSYTQIAGACIIHLLTIQAGINMAFSAILLPQLQRNDTDFRIEESEGTWIASLVTISLPIGSLISGPLMDRFGRKNFALYMCVPYFVSWILIYWSYNVYWLYVGRILAGAAAGLSNVAIYYTSEVTHPLWRPMLLGLNSVFVSFGILITAIFGTWLHWRTIAVIFAVLTAFIFSLITILPESPHWLLSFGNGIEDGDRVQKARKCVKWFNRNDLQAEEEVVQLLSNYRRVNISNYSGASNQALREKLRSFRKPEIYKPILLLLVIFFFQQNSGSYVIIFYAVNIFGTIGVKFGFLDSFGAMVLLGFIRFVVAIVALILSRRYGRRTLLIISGLGMGTMTLSAAICMEFTEYESKIPAFIFILLFVCFGAIGWQTIPWSLTGELLPTKLRAIVGGIMISYTYLLMFLAVKTFPDLQNQINIKGIFWLFSSISFLSTLFVCRYLPETFGKSLVEIESFFK